MAHIHRLPQELIAEICFWLNFKDIQRLRLCDRKLARASLQPYAHKSFSRVSATCSTVGLERLQLLSQHPQISKAVREVALFVTPSIIWESFTSLTAMQEGDDNENYRMFSLPEFYSRMRKTLVSSLKKLPQLKLLIVNNADPELVPVTQITYTTIDVLSEDNGMELTYTSSKRVERAYGFEVVFSVLPELERQSIQLTVNLHSFDDYDNSGFISAPLLPDRMNAPSGLQHDIFGVEDFCVTPILQNSLQNLELHGDQRLFDRRWDILVLVSSCPLKSLHLHGFNLTSNTLLTLGPGSITSPTDHNSICSETIHFPKLINFTLSDSQFEQDFSIFIEKHLPTLKTISLVMTSVRIDNAWGILFEAISQHSNLEKLHIDRGRAMWNSGAYTARAEPVEYATWAGKDNIRAKVQAVLTNGQVMDRQGAWDAGYLDLLSTT